MACENNQVEYTITLETFPLRHGYRCTKQDLVFCLEFRDDGTVSGAVFDTSNTRISDVRGRYSASGHTGIEFVRLTFIWPPAEVIIVGMRFTDGRPKIFGRYLTRPADSLTEETFTIPTGPDTGDTGTGTGQQT